MNSKRLMLITTLFVMLILLFLFVCSIQTTEPDEILSSSNVIDESIDAIDNTNSEYNKSSLDDAISDDLLSEEPTEESTDPTLKNEILPEPEEDLPRFPASVYQPVDPDVEIPEDFQAFDTYLYRDSIMILPLSDKLQYHTYLMSQKYQVPYRVILGIMGVETTWKADIGVVVGETGAYVGLGMLSVEHNAHTFAKRGIDIYTPQGNIEAICSVMKDKLEECNGDIHMALMCYNYGSGGAQGQFNKGVYQTEYSLKVCELAESFNFLPTKSK